MKNIVVLALAVFVGIYIYRKMAGRKGAKPEPGVNTGVFNGPDVDPITGDYLQPGAMNGTVSFSAQDS